MEKRYRLGNYEFAFEFTDAEGNKTTGVSTPSMWAAAKTLMDELTVAGGHSTSYVAEVAMGYLHQLVAVDLGLAVGAEPTMEGACELGNLYEIADVSDRYTPEEADGGEDAENPTGPGREGGRAAR